MRADIITQAVPDADPDFIRIMATLSEPTPDLYETIMSVLPKLHELFLRKRRASQANDHEAFSAVVAEEIRLIESLERSR